MSEETRVSSDECIRRWPRLVAHMICESLGYFSPRAAANAVAAYKNGEPYACEWYSHMCSCKGRGFFDEPTLLQIGRDVVRYAFEGRHGHHGYMAEYQRAIQLVRAEQKQRHCTSDMLASWF